MDVWRLRAGLIRWPVLQAALRCYEVANALHPGLKEGPNDLVRNATSVSRTIARQYFHDFATRYKGRSSLLLWDILRQG